MEVQETGHAIWPMSGKAATTGTETMATTMAATAQTTVPETCTSRQPVPVPTVSNAPRIRRPFRTPAQSVHTAALTDICVQRQSGDVDDTCDTRSHEDAASRQGSYFVATSPQLAKSCCAIQPHQEPIATTPKPTTPVASLGMNAMGLALDLACVASIAAKPSEPLSVKIRQYRQSCARHIEVLLLVAISALTQMRYGHHSQEQD